MNDVIRDELHACAQTHDVRILLAVESGSRSWGFASANSDYDVRFVYARPKDDYLRLEKTRDTIEWRLDEVLDITGWDLAKYLRLLRSSNPSALEWLTSPTYVEDASFQTVRELAGKCVSPAALGYHYLGMAKKNVNRHLSASEPSLKKYLYVVRALLACRWAIDKRTVPPMAFGLLCDEYLNDHMRAAVDEMVARKRTGDELDHIERNVLVDTWITSQLIILGNEMGKVGPSKVVEWEEVDRVFLELLEA